MKYLTKFSVFEEVSPRDISFIQSMSDYFTVAFEFEIETDDRTNIKIDFGILGDRDIVDDVISIVEYEMTISRPREKLFVDELIQTLIDACVDGIISSEMMFDIFNPDKFATDRKMEIASGTRSILMSYISNEDWTYLESKVAEHLPNFTNKWRDKIEFVEDSTLERGIEIKPKTYLVGLSEGIEMINDFYSDLESQDYWKFTDRTGLHINIGVNKPKIEWNQIKGILLLNDAAHEKVPFVFNDMIWRLNNKFCGSIISSIKNMKESDKEILKKSLDLSNVKSLETTINKFIGDKIIEWGFKNFGFNITKISSLNYCEFRYAGGEISKETLIDKLKYFSFIVYAMTNEDYKRKDYLKKLYKFVDEL